MTLLNPEYGAAIDPGTTIKIEWRRNQEHEQHNWDLTFSPDAGMTWFEIAIDLPVDQFEYIWTLPDSLLEQARIRITQDNEKLDYHATNEFALGDSYKFEIVLGNVDNSDDLEYLSVYPNPVGPETTITFNLKKHSQVNLKVFDIMGNLSITLMKKELYPGIYTINLLSDNLGRESNAQGMYLLHLVYGNNRKVIKLILNSSQ